MILVLNHLQQLNGNKKMMKRIFSFLLLISLSFGVHAQVKYRGHIVKQGETAYSIAELYGLSVKDIYRYNPSAKNGVNIASLLIFPVEGIINSTTNETLFVKHKVKRKETLFSISQDYDIEVSDLKKYNKQLYSKPLKKNDILLIPIYQVNSTTTGQNTTISSETKIYIVQPKETRYGIARRFGLSISELEELNPTLGEDLPIGYELIVPMEEVVDTALIDEEEFSFYEVLPKEGFFRLKVKLGLTKEEIISLNPFADEGLKEGMVLKIPKGAGSEDILNVINLEDYIIDVSEKHLAVMLPFRLKRVETDSLKEKIELLKNDNTLRVALDFYSGVLMATEFASDKGIAVRLDVYDTEASENKVSQIISKNSFKDVDAVIGPLLQKNVIKATSLLRNEDVPVFSPLSNREIRSYTNFFQTLPSNSMKEEAMIDYLKEFAEDKNVLVICDNKKKAQKTSLLSALSNAKPLDPRSGEKGSFLYNTDLLEAMEETLENWVILESLNPVLVSNVVGLLNGLPEEFTVRLFTLDKNEVYDYHDISNNHLAKLNFTYPSTQKDYNHKEPHPFLVSYKNKYGVYPNKYATRGFDVTYDIILRLASSDDAYEGAKRNVVTEYVENKFNYKKKILSGFYNTALYIVKYNNDLQVEVVR
jgi:LysM repeat protein